MGRPTAYRTPTTMQPLNLPNVKGGEIVIYRAPVPVVPPPVRLYPEPYRPDRPQSTPKNPDRATGSSGSQSGNQTAPTRKPVVDSDGRSSSQSRNPQSYPNQPNPLDNWKTLADFDAWRNGKNKAQIDEEREAYEFTKEWGKSGGVLYPFTDAGPRIPILSGNFEKANRYRVRNGLPSIDRYGYEQSSPINPSSPPRGDFASNPFKQTRPDSTPTIGTPSNFDASPYNFDIDPDTGLPYTDLQRKRGDELGRPHWHINPETGNPWGKDEPGTPIPLPFDGAPGGGVRYPLPKTGGPLLGTWRVGITASINGFYREVVVTGYSTDAPTVNRLPSPDPNWQFCNAVALVGSGSIHQIHGCFSHYPIFLSGGFTANDSGTTTDDSPVEFTPIGRPAPLPLPFSPTPTPTPTRTRPEN